MDTLHPFGAAISLKPLGDGRWRGHTSAAYANMVGPFGGVTAAVMLAAVRRHPAHQGEPLSLTVNFAGPIADGAFEVHADPVRTNRSTQHWVVRLYQGNEVAATATAVFATRRETWSVAEAGFPAAPPPEALKRMAPLERVRWTAAYEMRFVKGALQLDRPTAASDSDSDSESLLWVRDAPPRALDALSLTALSDVFFPRIFVRRPAWVPVGTVSLTVYFHADAATLATVGGAPLLGHARAHQFRQGYFDQAAQLWDAGGRLLAISHQIVYYRE